MIYTDFKKVASNNPGNGYQELHDLARSAGIGKGKSYFHKTMPYYSARSKAMRIALKKVRARAISTRQMNRLLAGLPILDYEQPPDFNCYMFSHRYSRIMKALADSVAMGPIPRRSSILAKASLNVFRAKYVKGGDILTLELRTENPDGTAMLNGREFPIPPEAQELILKYRVPRHWFLT